METSADCAESAYPLKRYQQFDSLPRRPVPASIDLLLLYAFQSTIGGVAESLEKYAFVLLKNIWKADF